MPKDAMTQRRLRNWGLYQRINAYKANKYERKYKTINRLCAVTGATRRDITSMEFEETYCDVNPDVIPVVSKELMCTPDELMPCTMDQIEIIPVMYGDKKNNKGIYFMQSKQTGLIKIGYATGFRKRKNELEREYGSLTPLLLLKADWKQTTRYEAAFHWRFREHHSHLEWFHPAPPLTNFIQRHRSE